MHKAVVLCGHNLKDWRRKYASGDAPAALPYEVDSLDRAGISVEAHGVWAGRFPTKAMRPRRHMRYYPAVGPAIPHIEADCSRVTHPFATKSNLYSYKSNSVRLACLIHAASVRSEPESN